MSATTQPETKILQTQLFLDREQLANRWNCSVSTVKRIEKRGELQASRPSPRVVRYKLEMIEQIEKSR
ncbi:MAG: hypothetical protein ACRDBP_05215 [Luteolibacter sp.]